jgi:hypothetical protein
MYLLLLVKRARNSRRKHTPKVEPLAAGSGSAFWTALPQVMNTESGAVSYLSDQQTQSNDPSYLDNLISKVGMYSSFITLGATLLGVGTAAAGAAPIVTFAGGVAALATLTGVFCGTFALGNDVYNLYTNVSDLVTNQPVGRATR